MYTFFKRLKNGFRGIVAIDLDKPGIKYEVRVRNPLNHLKEPYLSQFSTGLTVGGEDKSVTGAVRLFGSSLYLGLTDIIPRRAVKAIGEWAERNASPGYSANDLDFIYGYARRVHFELGQSARLTLWHTNMNRSTSDKKNWPWLTNGWEFELNWFGFIFGTPTYEERPLYTNDTSPAGVKDSPVTFMFDAQDGRGPQTYTGKVTIVQARWPRRFWGYGWKYRASIEVENPPKYAGKGDNAHDLDDNATYSVSWGAEDTCPTHALMVERYVESVSKSIAKYGPARGSGVA